MAPTTSRRWLITDTDLFDGSGSARRRADVLVDGERIRQVAGHIDPVAHPGATVVDGSGRTLMPGMIDGHTHFDQGSTVHHVTDGRAPAQEKLLLAAHSAATMIEHGFTSAYMGGGRNPAGELILKRAIDEGWMRGPRLRVASWESITNPLLDPTHPVHTDRPSVVDGMRQWVHEMADLGVDIVKIPLTGESGLAENTSRDLIYTDEEVGAAADAARERGVWLTAHAHSAEGIHMALRHGFRAIYHVSFADDDAIAALAAAKDEVFVAPSPGILYGLLHRGNRPPTDGMETVVSIDSLRVAVPKMKEAGIRIVPGGDYGFAVNPVGENARDLQLFVEWFGMTPAEALRAATEHGGFAMNMADDLGLVREGYLADLLLVDGDPTADVTIMQDPDRLVMIMQGGVAHKLPPGHVREGAPVAVGAPPA